MLHNHTIQFEQMATLEARAELIAASQQPHITKTTPRDAGERFCTDESTRAWVAAHHFITLRERGSDVLGGVVWFSAHGDRYKDRLDTPETFAIRLYESCVGRRLALPFMREAHELFFAETGSRFAWLDVAATNTGARHIYEQFGYTYTQADIAERERLVMIYDRSTYET